MMSRTEVYRVRSDAASVDRYPTAQELAPRPCSPASGRSEAARSQRSAASLQVFAGLLR